jgi:hypothetical protein
MNKNERYRQRKKKKGETLHNVKNSIEIAEKMTKKTLVRCGGRSGKSRGIENIQQKQVKHRGPQI